ncbi:MAG: hypothetical protein BWX88_05212 [Planctomycetes bacterium ADurb.Bin126]|nr:MAG: hypothetical protein BWX88_05212 [Planctomycetes bacterium ADurb.Bin126]
MPSLTSVPPLWSWAPVKASVPAPTLTRLVVPTSLAAMVAVAPARGTSIVPAPGPPLPPPDNCRMFVSRALLSITYPSVAKVRLRAVIAASSVTVPAAGAKYAFRLPALSQAEYVDPSAVQRMLVVSQPPVPPSTGAAPSASQYTWEATVFDSNRYVSWKVSLASRTLGPTATKTLSPALSTPSGTSKPRLGPLG